MYQFIEFEGLCVIVDILLECNLLYRDCMPGHGLEVTGVVFLLDSCTL